MRTICALLLCLSLTSVHSQEKKPERKLSGIGNPAEAGPDFKVQGEYAGTVQGKGKYGVQVVALGDGKFDVYFLAGGLPGDGWDTKSRFKISADTKDGKVAFSGKEASGTLAEGKVSGMLDEASFSLNRVERKSPTIGAPPPANAIVLFDGKDPSKWKNGQLVEENLLLAGVNSTVPVGQGKFHLEFRTPFQPKSRGQGRGNSGVYIMGNEVQVLDSFGLNGENNECGGFYGRQKPLVNMCLPPLAWQTYDIELKPDANGTLVTVEHNGVVIHKDFLIKSNKGSSVNLQDHGNYVVYRNIWYVPAEAK